MRLAARAVLAVLALMLLATVMPSSAAAIDEQAEIVQIAYAHLGDKFKIGANGPTRFDCSGFLWFTFNTAGLCDRIGGKARTAAGFQKYFRQRGLLFTDPKLARVGDLAFYANPAKHSAIVTRIDNKGRPHINSALTIGVRETKYNTLDVRFDSFAHVGLGMKVDPSPSPSDSPSPSPSASSSVDPSPSVEPSTPPPSDSPPSPGG
jgi:hypothetical protein